ncbi:Calcium and integrin-binding protein 1, partial [Araneus ventricosus]
NNPFADRICEIFSSESDGLWSFEDFLDMVSVFSPATPPEKKAEYAFCIYDFDGDGFLSKEDIAKLITALTAGEILTDDDIQVVVERTMEEADIDKDGMLSPAEFKHVLMKCPDFARSCSHRLITTKTQHFEFISRMTTPKPQTEGRNQSVNYHKDQALPKMLVEPSSRKSTQRLLNNQINKNSAPSSVDQSHIQLSVSSIQTRYSRNTRTNDLDAMKF